MLKSFLEAKPLFYEEIDYKRMPRVYMKIKASLKLPKIIHIVGTNGKGTTGRFLATALSSLGKKVTHYTSPHIVHFNERIWLNGTNVTDTLLDATHLKLLALLEKKDADALSYFEYTTLLALLISQESEYLVLEAGLGGEYDATAVFRNILTLITPIDRDHEAFLGSTITSIAQTKLNAIQRKAIIAKQKHQEVFTVARAIAEEKNLQIIELERELFKEDEEKIVSIAKENNLAPYLVDNLRLAISALKELGITYNVENFQNSRLFGRLTEYRKNILLDVGHNTLAAKAIAKTLQGEKYRLIYNSYKDKNYREILTTLQPIIESVELIEIENERVESIDVMQEILNKLGINHSLHKEIIKEKKYLVFGSFSVVEAFLKMRNE